MSNSIPDINARTPQDKERILEQTEKKIMRNERLWNTNRLYRLIVQTIVDAVLPNYYHDPQSVRRNNPVEYRASVASIKEEYSKFIKERWVPLINIQLSLGEDQARENGFAATAKTALTVMLGFCLPRGRRASTRLHWRLAGE